MQGEFALLVDDGMPGVASSLIPDHDVIRFGHEVDHAAFSLVSPVDSYDRSVGHFERYLFSFYCGHSGRISWIHPSGAGRSPCCISVRTFFILSVTLSSSGTSLKKVYTVP